MKTIFCYPFHLKNNRYIDIHKSLWSELGYKVTSLKGLTFFTLINRNNNYAIFNWLEDSVIRANGKSRLITFVYKVVLLFTAKLFCKHVIWVRHNIKPHSLKGEKPLYLNLFEKIYLFISDCVVTHADIECKHKHHYVVPHPLYSEGFEFKTAGLNDDPTIDFIFFGAVTKYKNLDVLLKMWPSNKKLVIAGACKDEVLKNDLEEIIMRRNLMVDWLDRFIQDDELNNLLKNSRVVLIPHSSGSMIVSGSFYHAVSYGCEVIMSNNAFYDYLNKFFPYVHVVNDASIDEKLDLLLMENKKNRVIKCAIACFGNDKVKDAWRRIICSQSLGAV